MKTRAIAATLVCTGMTLSCTSPPPPSGGAESTGVGSEGSTAAAGSTLGADSTAAPSTTTTGSADTTTADSSGGPPLPRGEDAVFTWRGFEHEWLRTVVGFRVPHRISRLASHVSDDMSAGEGDTRAGTASFTFGQATGVDGNYMRPLGHYGAVHAPDLVARTTTVNLSWSDDGDGGTYPQAGLDVQAEAVFEAMPEGWMLVPFLRGFDLDVTCDDASQPPGEPCNSNGMWPYRFAMAVTGCSPARDALHCAVEVSIHRAWTPNLGGLPGIEEKPFADVLDFELALQVGLLAGDPTALGASPVATMELTGFGHDDDPAEVTAVLGGSPMDFDQATCLLTGFGFELFKAFDEDSHFHLGRYIGALRFGVEDVSYDPARGSGSCRGRAQVWLPDTVVDSGVDYQVQTRLAQLSHPQAQVLATGTVEGSLCANSDGAPFFSEWNQCGSPQTGPEQTTDVQTISAP